MSIVLLRVMRVAATMIVTLPTFSAVAQQAPSQSLAKAQERLLQLTVPDSMETEVPMGVRDAISDFKQALARQTDAVITRLPSDATVAIARQRLSQAMPSTAIGKISDDQWRKMGEDSSKQPIAGLYGGEFSKAIESLVVACAGIIQHRLRGR